MNKFSVTQTVAAIQGDQAKGWKMLHLLYSMDRSVIRAIVRNTVAYDTLTSQAKWLQMPGPTEGKVPGVYVIGLGRDDGRFLNIKEMLKLADGIEDYVSGYHQIKRYHRIRVQGGVVLLSPAEQAQIDWVNRVDKGSVVTRPVPDDAQYLKQDAEVPRIEALASGLRARCQIALDPTQSVRQVQSPLYVGCSVDLRRRTESYSRDGLVDMNKPLGLTLRVLEALEIPMKLSIQVAIKIWELDQLPLAEQLVATLAGSLVYQYGFNATETGGTGSKSIKGHESRTALNRSRDLVMVHSNAMLNNLRNMATEINRRIDFAEDLYKLHAVKPDVIASINSSIAEMRNLSLDHKIKWKNIEKELEEKEREIMSTLQDFQLQEWQCNALLDITKRRNSSSR